MPAGHSQRNNPPEIHHLIHPQASPTNKATHIRNKDGTKLITVPSRKVSNPESASAAPSPPPPPPPPPPTAMDYSNGASANNLGGKKKKKKRGKQQIVQQHRENHISPSGEDVDDYGYGRSNAPPPPPPNHAHQYQQDIRESMAGFDDGDAEVPDLIDPDEEDPDDYSDQEGPYEDDESYSPPPRVVQPAPAPAASKKKNKKKKKKNNNNANNDNSGTVQSRKGKDRIWNTSTAEERERIKDFWLSLGEEERRSLVKVEKEAVLRKMKEQQKHSCSCSVCGRKRTAIEEELEVLYDAYYEELEQYANQQQTNRFGHIPHTTALGTYSNSSIPPPPPPPGPPPAHHGHPSNPSNHRIEELDDDEYDDEDDDEFEDEDEEEILEHTMPQQQDTRPDFFNFGNSLTVQGGILTVADDLLKNDGKKFIEMMEQLAERRMAREEEASAAANGHSPMSLSMQQAHAAHSHPQPEYDDDEDYDEEDEDEEYDDEDEEDDEPDTMTEEQRMEEGRRMFQIFAARMFEQRVLTAYREKVARERQRKLLEELEEETRRNQEREEKKAKDKDKKKERKRLQRQAKEEERLKKEAEKAAEESKQKEIESRKAEEQKKRKEEQRLKREAERKAAEEERQRKEEEKRKRIQEERERETERERKRKEHQERERKKKEEAAKRVKEEKEAREKETREKREQAEKEKKAKELKAKKDAVAKEQKRKDEEAKAKQEAAIAAAARRTQTSAPSTLPQSQAGTSNYGSPLLAPAIPKQTGASPGPRPRNSSQQSSIQNSQGSSPKTPNIAPRMGGSASPGTPILQQNIPGPIHVPNKVFGGFPSGITPTSPLPHYIAPPPGVTAPESAFGNIGMNGPMQPFLPNMGQQRPSIGNGIPMYPPGQSGFGPNPQFRGFGSPNGIPMQIPPAPGMNSMAGQGRGFMGDIRHQLPPGVPLPPPGSPFIGRAEPVPMSGHSRAPSGSFEPIHRPTPIQRPSSVAPPKGNSDDTQSSIDELSKVMGSRALLEDDDVEALPENMSPNSRRASNTQFAPRPIRGVPTSSPIFGDVLGGFKDFGIAPGPGPSWSNPVPLGGSLSGSLPSAWANGAGWSDTDAARSTFNRRRQGRLDQIRIIACQKCRELGEPGSQFVEIGTLQRAIQRVAPHDLAISVSDISDVLDVEGDPQNGGGNFKITNDANGRTLVQYEPDESSDLGHMSVGEIGSPSTQGAVPFRPTQLGPPGMATSPAGF